MHATQNVTRLSNADLNSSRVRELEGNTIFQAKFFFSNSKFDYKRVCLIKATLVTKGEGSH